MKQMNRREALQTLTVASSAVLLSAAHPANAAGDQTSTGRLGIVSYAFNIHRQNQWAGRYRGWAPALALLEESHRLGAAGIQTELGPEDTDHLPELRQRTESYGMYFEASIMPPKTDADVDRFEREVRLAKEAGATLARTVIMPGRRYEQFKSIDDFWHYEKLGFDALQRAEPVLGRHQFRLAVENHKDQRIPEKLETMRRLDSEWIGLCVDVGNSFTLLEDPLATVKAFAPHAMTVHFKDQAVRETKDGFLFADVALGQGCLDLASMVKLLREANPGIRFNFEGITRDALSVPVLADSYWSTMPDTPARDLAQALRRIRACSAPKPFASVSHLSVSRQLALEQRNVQESLVFARQHLDL